jgi:hypothetical protein
VCRFPVFDRQFVDQGGGAGDIVPLRKLRPKAGKRRAGKRKRREGAKAQNGKTAKRRRTARSDQVLQVWIQVV